MHDVTSFNVVTGML